MVLFQNKIIYMPSLPPGSRRERLHHYSKTWAGVSWDQRQVKSLDGTQLTVAIARPASSESVQKQQTRTIVLYFQGNGASIPPRTPMLSNVLRSAAEKSPNHWLLAALSYRGYWTSSGRAHQRGIEQDAEAFVNWAVETYGKDAENTELILWGQSIGAGVAAYAASKYLESTSDIACKPTLNRLVLETPFVSIKSMLAAIYPDWWVPYKHLWPFLRSRWDSQDALRKIASSQRPPKILMLVAARDEVVPRVQSDQLESLCKHLHLQVTRKNVLGALHTQATSLEQGGKAISTWMRDGKLH
jgi:pimeloyl-ACP methyl ester carboxylesterase